MSDQQQKTERDSEWRRQRLAAVYNEPLRARILCECMMRETSARSFHETVGGAPLLRVLQAFELLVQYEWLEQVRAEEVADGEPGEVERFYRAVELPIYDEQAFAALPESANALVSWRIVESMLVRVKEAQKAGTLGARADRHLSWMPLTLDEQGWRSVIGRLDAVFWSLEDEQKEAEARMRESGEEPIEMTVALLGFESPVPGRKKRQ